MEFIVDYRKPKSQAKDCQECGYVWTEEDRITFNFIRQHMVEKHGYKQVGGQVFRSIPCIACPKPGLYRIGAVAYCKEHLHLGRKRLDWRSAALDGMVGSVVSANEQHLQKQDRRAAGHQRVVRRRK